MEKKAYQKPAMQVVELQHKHSLLIISGQVDSINGSTNPFVYQGLGDPLNPLMIPR